MNLVWFRSDLRIHNNSALRRAMDAGDSLCCFLLPLNQWQTYGLGKPKIEFVRASAALLMSDLNRLGVKTISSEVESFDAQITEIQRICSEYKIDSLFWNNEYPLDERIRDNKVQNYCEHNGIVCHRGDEALILPPGRPSNKQGAMYKVFTPFKRAWFSEFESRTAYGQELGSEFARELRQKTNDNIDTPRSFAHFDNSPATEGTQRPYFYPGEQAGLSAANEFCQQIISEYKNVRDFPADRGTSQLSAHLSAGTISPRTCLDLALEMNNGELCSGNSGATTWISQLIWREFYYHLIASDNRLSKNQPFKSNTNLIRWNDPNEALDRWKQGATGVPLVDAGMRQLNHQGWMHNRVRMVTAMYLTKNLFIDWRLGEQYFLEKLIDADFALNNGGWQWSASTGTDAVPYFRVFNPYTQAKRFDPDALYIKKYLPELNDLPAKTIHNEGAMATLVQLDYPKPITDSKSSRARAIDSFKLLADLKFKPHDIP